MQPASSSPTTAIPVYLLTGFLGSGKTTLLSTLIHEPGFADTAVIVNEFGEIGLDHVLLEKSDDTDVVLLDSGCLCCATNDPLQNTLEELYYRRLRQEIPPFQRVVVETSGLANPAPLINALAADASVSKHYRLAGVITTIDAIHGLNTVSQYQEAAIQLSVADRIVVTKTDLVTGVELNTVQEEIAAANPHASILTSALSGTAISHKLLAGLDGHQIKLAANDTQNSKQEAKTPFLHLFKYGISSHVLHATQPVSWPSYAAWVNAMQRQFGEKLLRVKGIVRFTDGLLYAIHGVHHLFSPPQPLFGPIPPKTQGAIVIIAQDTSQDELLGLFPLLSDQT
jgi:G3E family GTPase